MNKFSERLKELRIEKEIFQSDLAKQMGFTQSTISQWESGVREPNIDAIISLAIFFNVSTDYLLGVKDF